MNSEKDVPETGSAGWNFPRFARVTDEELRQRILFHIKYSRCKTWQIATSFDKFWSLSHAIRDLAVDRMLETQREYYEENLKRVYYISVEFLIGRSLLNNIISLGLLQAARNALEDLGDDLADLCEQESDAGLGNGGLGRLAACYMDSMATLGLPAYGYGLCYDHGMFKQEFADGWQVELPDDWLKFGTPWHMVRPEYTVPVLVYGRLENTEDAQGRPARVWTDFQTIEGVAYDYPVIGYGGKTVNILRLWDSRATQRFRLDIFNQGEYVKAFEEDNWAEAVTEVLYPSDNTSAGRELRLIQEYFLVVCSIHDIIRRHLKKNKTLNNLAEKNQIQLNDTHPALGVAELMRHLLDQAHMPWDKAWEITENTFCYTNHTLMPEALEKWPVPMFERVLPRHLQIIYEINSRFLNRVEITLPGDTEGVSHMSLIEESDPKQVRMANLAIVGSHSINGVSALHTELIKQRLVPDFARLWPERFNNKTNGISPRKWLLACNPQLACLICGAIGDGWVTNLDELKNLEKHASDPEFQRMFADVKRDNKARLAGLVKAQLNISLDPDSIFDVQIKRLHEYKRQFLNVMHIIALYRRLKASPRLDMQPRTFIFGAKAAPGYHRAKLIIKLINTVARAVNSDKDVRDRLKVVFLPDYRVSLAEIIIPGADLSEQISTAGTEASGTGNMKLSLNGALTIGTWDGANIEIAQAVGEENFFVFGHRAEQLDAMRRDGSYSPRAAIDTDPELRDAIECIGKNIFTPADSGLFSELTDSLTHGGDPYFHLADFRSYVECQGAVSNLYRRGDEWRKKAILNVARMGKFSSDRSISEYARQIWRMHPARGLPPVEGVTEDHCRCKT